MNDNSSGGLIYLATPYSHDNPRVMEARFEAACHVAGKLMANGELIFSPIAHTHPIAVRCDLPRGWDFWHKYDLEMLKACEKLLVVKMPGWDSSKGIAGEIAIAKQLGKPVEFMEFNLEEQ